MKHSNCFILQEFHVIDDASSINWCNDVGNSSRSKVLLLTRNNCSVTEQASNVQSQGGKGVLFITPNGKVVSIKFYYMLHFLFISS